MTPPVSDALLRDYRAGFLRWLGRREETALTGGYDLGRAALNAGRGLLEVVRVHHEVLVEVLRGTPEEELEDVGRAAALFLMEVLGSYEMAQGTLPGLRPLDPGR